MDGPRLPSILKSAPAIQDGKNLDIDTDFVDVQRSDEHRRSNKLGSWTSHVSRRVRAPSPPSTERTPKSTASYPRTPIYICAFQGNCNRLFPSRERVMLHRKRDHDSGDDRDILTWNE
ncbi:hypothetical protein EDD15DRAFT_2565893 [Pisolithus albus]|nr:hypothetical protein EDD15DRAFT_2565893 [Pisolithus albus]